MSKDIDSHINDTQGDLVLKADLPSSGTLKDKTKSPSPSTLLKLVHKSQPSSQDHFVAEVRMRGSHEFVMVAQDPFHHLFSALPLRFEESRQGRKKILSLICDFPPINDDALADFVEEDDDLLGMALFSFHLRILENLFVFGATRQANRLVINTIEGEFAGLDIYEDFIQYTDKISTNRGIGLQMGIPIRKRSLPDCLKFMNSVTDQFRKALWQNYHENSAIRQYLTTNLHFSVAA